MKKEPDKKTDELAKAVIGAAIEVLAPIHTAQVMSYLKATQLPLGLLINFNVPLLKNGIKRVILSDSLGDLGVLAVQSFGDVK